MPPNKARNKYLSDDHSDFTVSGRESIIFILNELARKNVPLSGVFNQGREVLLTGVLGVDTKKNTVYLDVNANEERNQQFLMSPRVIFHATDAGAKIQWACQSIESTAYGGYKAFRIQIPETLQRIQRRNVFRISTPIIHPVICHIPLTPEREIALPLVDICIEGIGVTLPSPQEPAIERNAQFKNCRLEHEHLAVAELTLSVQNLWDVTHLNGTTSRHAGMEFVDIRPKDQSAIQRFVYQLERLKIDVQSAR